MFRLKGNMQLLALFAVYWYVVLCCVVLCCVVLCCVVGLLVGFMCRIIIIIIKINSCAFCDFELILFSLINIVGPVSSVSKATRYGLKGPGIEFRWRLDFPHPSRPALVAAHPPIQWVPAHFRG
jgi:hypothetical protein